MIEIRHETDADGQRLAEVRINGKFLMRANSSEADRVYKLLKTTVDVPQRLLEDLTPGGSEFAGDAEFSARWVKEKMRTLQQMIVRLSAEKNELMRKLDDAELQLMGRAK